MVGTKCIIPGLCTCIFPLAWVYGIYAAKKEILLRGVMAGWVGCPLQGERTVTQF